MRSVCALILVVLFIPTAYGQRDFYIANEKVIPLPPSSAYRAFQVVEGEVEPFIRVWEGNPVVSVERLAVSEREPYRIVTLKRGDARGIRPSEVDFDREIDKVLASGSVRTVVEREVPVYTVGGVELFLVNRFLIRFQPDTDEEAARSFITRELGARIDEHDAARGRYTIEFPPDLPVREALRKVNESQESPLVWYAEPAFIRVYPPRDPPVDIRADPDKNGAVISGSAGSGTGVPCDLPSPPAVPPEDTYFREQWALNNPLPGFSDADINWVATSGSEPVTIAVIDIGVELNHPDLVNHIVAGADATGAGDAGNQAAHDYHGTAVAGLAAAETGNAIGIAGVAPRGRIASVRIGESNGVGGPWVTTPLAEVKAFYETVNLSAKVVVLAWNGAGAAVPSTEFTQAAEAAIASGALLVFSAGNHSVQVSNNGTPWLDSGVTWPATHASTEGSAAVRQASITVSATNQKDQLKTTVFGRTNCAAGPSDPDPTLGLPTWGSNFGPEVDLAAPGVRVCTTDTNQAYLYFGGTSAAAAITAGAAAVLFSLHPSATAAEVKAWLQESATDLCPKGVDHLTGHGRIDLASAIALAEVAVNLEVEKAEDRIKKDEVRWVKALVTRQGIPMPGVPVSFKVSVGLGLVAGTPVNTDVQGIAEVKVKGLKRFHSLEKIKAQAEDGSDVKVVKVPSLPAWVAWPLLLLAVGGLGRRWGNRGE